MFKNIMWITEEDLKRLTQDSNGASYSQVSFQYGNDASAGPSNSGLQPTIGPSREEQTDSPTCLEEADQAFSLPRGFEVPASIQLPETMKQHAIIEKTARFIASQGIQMEILLKAKQSNNVQFEFLSQNSILHPYYKFVMNAIKNGVYPVDYSSKETTDDIASAAEKAAATASGSVGAHLATIAKPVIAVPTIKYKPSANCAYTQLISKIKGVPLPDVLLDEGNSNASGGTNSPTIGTPNSGDGGGISFTPVLLQYNGNTFVTEPEVVEQNSNSNSQNSNSNLESKIDTKEQEPQVEILKNTSALALAQNYSSGDSETEDEADSEKADKVLKKNKPEPILNFPIPTENLKNIIDKTATYVIKNGRQFEETLRSKSEDRFTFLVPENEFYPYYMYKITDDPDAASKEQKTRKAAAVAAALLSKKGLNIDKTLSPVSFSIKPKDELPTSVLPQPALPQENSDDEDIADKKPISDNSTNQARTVPEHVQKAIQLVESQLMARNAQLAAAAVVVGSSIVPNRSLTTTPSTTTVRSRFDIDYNTSVSNTISKTQVKSTKAEQERNALYEQQQQNRQKELKKAEEKVKDKLAQIAREKLGGLISKEKQLQLERKRKAMAFLNQIKGVSTPTAEPDETATENKFKPPEVDDNATDDSEDDSVHSIPITSYGPPEEKTDDDNEDDDDEGDESLLKYRVDLVVTPPPLLIKSNEGNGASAAAAAVDMRTTTVTLSDDDDVQVVSESKPSAVRRQHDEQQRHKKRSLQKQRSRSRTHDSFTSAKRRKTSTELSSDEVIERQRSKSRKSSKAKKSSKSSRNKKKSKSKKRSHSRSPMSHSVTPSQSRGKSHRRSRSRYSRSCSEASVESATDRSHREKRNKRTARDATPTSKRKEKKQKYER